MKARSATNQKHIFILNPAAGKGQAAGIEKEIRAICDVAGLDYEIYQTTGPDNGEAYVRRCCEEQTAERHHHAEPGNLRFYACGGDGMLNEVVNGVMSAARGQAAWTGAARDDAPGEDAPGEDAPGTGDGQALPEVGCIPLGTGNDFVRNFPEADFTDLIGQIQGKASFCDLIRYDVAGDGEKYHRYCVNMFNIGFDCNVVDMTDRLKRLPLVAGGAAYLAGVAATLIRKKGENLRVCYEDCFVHDGPLLLLSIANGCFCGGGIRGLPRALTNDGRMDVSLVKNVSRSTFVRLFPKYVKGSHLKDPRLRDILRYSQEQRLVISANNDTLKLCVDGEIATARTVRFEICPGAFRFVIPSRRESSG